MVGAGGGARGGFGGEAHEFEVFDGALLDFEAGVGGEGVEEVDDAGHEEGH